MLSSGFFGKGSNENNRGGGGGGDNGGGSSSFFPAFGRPASSRNPAIASSQSSHSSHASPPVQAPSSNNNKNASTTPTTMGASPPAPNSRGIGPRTGGTGSTSGSGGASTRSLLSNTSNQAAAAAIQIQERTLGLFRKIIGQRTSDYVSDGPQDAPSRRSAMNASDSLRAQHGRNGRGSMVGRSAMRASHGESTDGGGGSGGLGGSTRSLQPEQVPTNSNLAMNEPPKRSFCICADPLPRRAVFAWILYSQFWSVVLMILTFVLLFGAPIRSTVIPPAGDAGCDGIFLLTFILFVFDILLRIDVEPNYFIFRIGEFTFNQRRRDATGASSSNSFPLSASMSASMNIYQGLGGDFVDRQRAHVGCCNIEIGSFLFWCDVISTLTLLHEISFIDPANFQETSITIMLDSFGIPISGISAINSNSPVELQPDLLVTIAKTARVARFIRSTTAVKISSKVNWFRLLDIINPFWWWLLIQRSLRLRRRVQRKSSSSNQDRNHLNASEMSEGFNAFTVNAANQATNTDPRISLMQRASDSFKSLRGGLSQSGAAFPQLVLRLMHIIPSEDSETRRQIAASRIQRAWRNSRLRTYHRSMADSATGEGWTEAASKTRGGGVRRLTARMRADNTGLSGHSTHSTSASVNSRARRGAQGGTGSNVAQVRNESQVGTAMRELTGQRVAIGILLALAITVLFTYTEHNATRASTMIVLHNQTGNANFALPSLNGARASSVPDLYYYEYSNGTKQYWPVEENGFSPDQLRPREKYLVTVQSTHGNTTVGMFSFKSERRQEALVSLLTTFFILFIWFFGVTAFAGPVMVLVVIPIERMVRLLGMLMMDPLGYENTPRYKRFMEEEDTVTKNTNWTKEVLRGMETSFLMSTILRIGSLMKVGFGSAGVEIIRNNLQKGQSKNMLVLNSEGSRVFCIFLFCDIRQFTDATECLQEEVFVFTNRIAAVVHSICHSYGGSANKNVGDAFLVSWLLDEDPSRFSGRNSFGGAENYRANNSQADKALLSVVKICMALHYDNFYIEAMSDVARDALLSKLSRRKGPVVQMGFGLHAGQAVQGAIGSQRKIDATYVSEHVERTEFLESSTKKYGVKMLMSDSFHRLLHPSNRRRCRKVDQIMIQSDDDEDEDDYESGSGTIIELLTFDMDIDALWRTKPKARANKSDSGHESESDLGSDKQQKREVSRISGSRLGRRISVRIGGLKDGSDELSEVFGPNAQAASQGEMKEEPTSPPELVLPNGPVLYNANVWVGDDMRRIRQLYSDGLFFQKFNSGLQSFYARDWEHARQCFTTILDRFEDGPSRYFLNEIEKNNCVPPRNFRPYGKA